MVNLGVPPSQLNRAALVCTCRGFRGFNLCSRVVAATAAELNDDDCCEGYPTHVEVYLEKLIQRLNTKKRAPHRLHAVRAASSSATARNPAVRWLTARRRTTRTWTRT